MNSPSHRVGLKGASGFSLVVSLVLMMMLTLVALAFISLAGVSVRQSHVDSAMATARANARMAVWIAIGELQKHAGSDQRATASSEQLSLVAKRGAPAAVENVKQKHWLGVWPSALDSVDSLGLIVGRHDQTTDAQNYLVDLREPSTPASGDGDFDAGRSDFSENGQLAWLVSSPGGRSKSLSPKDFVADEDSVVILGRGWETDDEWKDEQVSVPTVKVNEGTSQPGRYAYWVSDESMKANLAQFSRHGSGEQALAVAQTAPLDLVDPLFLGHQELVRGQDEVLAKLATRRTVDFLPLAGAGSDQLPERLKKGYHDLTTQSLGLLTNPQTGGFQQDLSAFLSLPVQVTAANYSSVAGEGFESDLVSGAPGLKVGDPIVMGSRHTETSPRFGALKAWADLANEVSGSGANASINVQRPTIWSSGNDTITGHVPNLKNVAPQAVHPIMTESSLGWDFTHTTGDPQGLRVHIYPKVVLWNPYNVTINAASYLVMMKTPHYGDVEINGQKVFCGETRFDFATAIGVGGASDNYYVGFVTEATAIPPGQALVFTPSTFNRSDVFGSGSLPINPSNYANNVLTARQDPAMATNFYRELVPGTSTSRTSNQVFWKRTVDGVTTNVPGIPSEYRPSYGFSNDSNGFYASFYISRGSADRFILKAMPGNNIPSSINFSSSTSVDYPTLQFILCQTTGTNSNNMNSKWWSAQKNDHSSNAGTPFASEPVGAPPRLWRRGVRLRWFDDRDDYAAANRIWMGSSPYNVNWTSEYNLRAGLVHTAWLGANGSYERNSKGSWVEANPGPYTYMWSPKSLTDGTDQAIYTSSGHFAASPFGTTQAMGGALSFPLFEVPRSKENLVSLADFQHAQLSYQTYHTSYVVGHSEQNPRSERAATVVRPGHNGSVTQNADRHINSVNNWNVDQDVLIQGQNHEILLYDMPFEVNHRLFDNYFLSGMSGSWDGESALPNDRLRLLASSARSKTEVMGQIGSGDYRFHQAGSFLANEGAFNVNSTSVAAWTAHLSGLRGLSREAMSGTATGGSWYSRMQHPVLGVDASGASASQPEAWAGVAALSDDDLKKLAAAIVEEVKLRGPFISLSDFVNRRLVAPPASIKSLLYEDPLQYSLERTGKIGALGAAIQRAGLNVGLSTTPNPSAGLASRFGTNERAMTTEDVNQGYFVYGAQPDTKTSGLPGNLSQGDLLAALAPTLTARGDTFTIRAYGEARSADGQVVLARAWCEVTVQRVPDYVDGSNDPAVRSLVADSADASDPKLALNGELTEVNRRFGRKFEMISFRWLNESEI